MLFLSNENPGRCAEIYSQLINEVRRCSMTQLRSPYKEVANKGGLCSPKISLAHPSAFLGPLPLILFLLCLLPLFLLRSDYQTHSCEDVSQLQGKAWDAV